MADQPEHIAEILKEVLRPIVNEAIKNNVVPRLEIIESKINAVADKQYYTLPELANLLNRHYQTLYRHIKEGKLKTNKSGGNHIVTQQQLQDYLTNNSN